MQPEVVDRLRALILEKIGRDRFELPSMPRIALRCKMELEDDDVSFKKITSLLERDPLLAAKILQVASSPAVGGAIKVTSLADAVSRLGVKNLRLVLVHCSAHEVFVSRDPRTSRAMMTLWTHAMTVAILARDLAAVQGSATPDIVYLAGLLHDVGQPLAAAFMLELERHSKKMLVPAEDWVAVVSSVSHDIGVALAEKWELPAEVTEAIRCATDYDPVNRTAPSNYVRFANALAEREGICLGEPNKEDAETLVMIGRSMLGIEDDILAPLLETIRERVSALID